MVSVLEHSGRALSILVQTVLLAKKKFLLSIWKLTSFCEDAVKYKTNGFSVHCVNWYQKKRKKPLIKTPKDAFDQKQQQAKLHLQSRWMIAYGDACMWLWGHLGGWIAAMIPELYCYLVLETEGEEWSLSVSYSSAIYILQHKAHLQTCRKHMWFHHLCCTSAMYYTVIQPVATLQLNLATLGFLL